MQFSEAQPAEVQSAAHADLHLWGDTYLADPVFLLLVPLALLLVVYGRRGRARGRVSALPAVALPKSLRQRLGFLVPLVEALALVAAVVALARPLRGNEQLETTSEGVDIALVVDRSSSMQFEDLEAGKDRLEVTKEVVGDFARRRMTDREGAADNVALVTFARYPQLLVPFTLDVDALEGFLEDVKMVEHRAEDGTAIGVALAKAVQVLSGTDAKSKVVVLLTDGENTVDEIEPLAAADLAAEEGVRVYTLLAGRYLYQRDVFGRVHATEEELDATELQAIAERTGGRFYRARDREGLEAVYTEIEELVRTPRTERRYTETYDLYPLVLLGALCSYVLARLLDWTLLWRIA